MLTINEIRSTNNLQGWVKLVGLNGVSDQKGLIILARLSEARGLLSEVMMKYFGLAW